MAIRWREIDKSGNVVLEQSSLPPTVYLDNWTYNYFLDHEEDAQKFIQIMNGFPGTLQISDMNMIEAIKGKGKEKFGRLLDFIKAVDCASIDTNPERVVKGEIEFKRGASQNGPCVDSAMMEALFKFKKNHLEPFSLADLFDQLRKDFEAGMDVTERLADELNPDIEKARSDKAILERVRNRFKQRGNILKKEEGPYTKYLWDCITDYIVIQKDMHLDEGEWKDILHLIVPVAYSNFTTMDGRWVEFIKQSKLEYPHISKVYSQKNMQQFLADLEAFDVMSLKGSWHTSYIWH